MDPDGSNWVQVGPNESIMVQAGLNEFKCVQIGPNMSKFEIGPDHLGLVLKPEESYFKLAIYTSSHTAYCSVYILALAKIQNIGHDH